MVALFTGAIVVVAPLAVLGSLLDWELLKVGEERNIPAWFSSMQLLVISMVLIPIVIRDADRRQPVTWALALVPGLFALLSLDEVAMLHERLGDGSRPRESAWS